MKENLLHDNVTIYYNFKYGSNFLSIKYIFKNLVHLSNSPVLLFTGVAISSQSKLSGLILLRFVANVKSW